ncbi:hypothetical protein [Thermogutta sp.]|uniref:GlsB/YeaQ/YmgE family stress response membrane protein n=1 Tax=Thermogutta sp. TaxID=1962930 RepID=UPI00321FB76B
MDFPFRLPLLTEYWIELVLVWLGFGTVIGLLARVVFPGREPSGPLGTVLIGVIGAVVGPLFIETVCALEEFNPISPLGFVAALGGASVVLVLYRFLLLVMSDHLPPQRTEERLAPPPEYPPPPPPYQYPWPPPPTA